MYSLAMEIHELEALVALARHRRFTAAAVALGVSQPTLSRAIQNLERDARAALVIRAPEGIVLTEAGSTLLSHAERVVATLQSARVALEEMHGEPRGAVAIGTLSTVGTYVLPTVIAEFHRRHPAVRLSVREGFREELETLVARGDLDMAIIQTPARREDLTVVVLWHEDYVLAVPPQHRLHRARRAVALADVAGEAWVVIPGGTSMHAIEQACAARGIAPNVALVTDNVESVRRMVEAGLGLALVPRIMAREGRRWRASLVPVAGAGVRRSVAMVHRGQAYLSVAARAMRDAVVAAGKKIAA